MYGCIFSWSNSDKGRRILPKSAFSATAFDEILNISIESRLSFTSFEEVYLFRFALASFPKTRLRINSSATFLHFSIRNSR